MSVLAPIAPHLTHKCNLRLFLGNQGDGDPVWDTTPYRDIPCRYSATRKTVRGFQGTDDVIATRALFFIDGDFPTEIRSRSQVEYVGETFEVVGVNKFSTEVEEEIHHWELLCR